MTVGEVAVEDITRAESLTPISIPVLSRDRHESDKETDHQLMGLIAVGDTSAFEELIRRYQQSVLNLAFRFLGDREEAKDIAQETFLRIYQTAYRYRPDASLKQYIFKIATNICLDYINKKKPLYTDEVPDRPSHLNPLRDLQQNELSGAVTMAVQSLPENQRIALIFHHFEGLKYAQIAEVMDTTVSAVESLLVRAKRTLRDKLKNLL